MNNLRSISGAALRTGLCVSKKLGLDFHPTRNALNRIIGVRAQWCNEEEYVSRGLVVEREIGGYPVRFFISDESDSIQQIHMSGLWYEDEELKLIRDHYSGGTFVDVGANVGNHSLFAAITLGAPVIAFEPNAPVYRNCVYNFLLNGLADRATVHKIGLSDKNENATLGAVPYRNLGATKPRAGEGPLVLRRGDEVLPGQKIGFIKIDVEGMEIAALRGLEETIQRHRPTLLVEVDDSNLEAFNSWVTEHRYGIVEKLPKLGNVNFLVCSRGVEDRFNPSNVA